MTDAEATAWPLSPGADDTARAWLRAGSPPGTAPRQAASVCLLRDPGAAAAGGPEVLWITRGRQLAVAPGMLAFPGGAVDDVDRARRPGQTAAPDRFAVLARAAVRELAEETGHVVPARSLHPLVRWVTPEHEPRRFDTTFLVGVLPPGADPAPLPPGEVHEHGWARPADLLDEVASGRRTALPPTRAVLARLARAVEAVLAGRGTAAGDGVPGGVPGADDAVVDEVVDAVVDEVVAVLARQAVLVPVVPRAVWRDIEPAADPAGGPARDPGDGAARGVDLLLPRHAGEVP